MPFKLPRVSFPGDYVSKGAKLIPGEGPLAISIPYFTDGVLTHKGRGKNKFHSICKMAGRGEQ